MKKLFFLCLILISVLSGCSSSPLSQEFFAMDTVMHITLYDNNEEWLEKAEEEVAHLESLLSVTKPSSELHKINNADGSTIQISLETANLIKTAKTLGNETGGLFDITVYPAVKAWGFTLGESRVPSEEELKGLLPLIDSNAIQIAENNITLPSKVQLDLGGIAKGYAADKTVEQLIANGCTGGILNFGGNVKTIGKKPNGELFTVAVQDPSNSSQTLGTLSVPGNTAVVTSGDSQRYFEKDGVKYHHILDPHTAAPAKSDLSSVTVVCSSATRADAFATALYIMGLEEGMNFVSDHKDLEALFVTKKGEIHLSEGLSFTPNQ